MNRIPSPLGFICGLLLASLGFAGPREEFLKLIDRPKVPAAPIIEYTTTADGFSQQHFSFQSDAQQRVPGIVIRTLDGAARRPVVIVLHGTGGWWKDVLPDLRQLALKGFAAVAIDGRYHGERTANRSRGTGEYFAAIVRAWNDGREHPFFFDTAWDVMRLIDYLQTRDDIDGSRIGLIGISKGGIETYLSAAIDPRIGAAVPCIGVQSFKWALENNMWPNRIETIQAGFDSIVNASGIAQPDAVFVKKFYDRVSPGIDGQFDGPSMLPLIAPRPLLVINGDTDARTPLPGLKECTDAAMAAYKAQGAEDRFVVRIQPRTGHRVNPDSKEFAADFFVKWLKP